MRIRAAAALSHLDPLALTLALRETLSSPRYRPPALPTVAIEVMRITSHPDAQFTDVVRVLDRDPVLAARMLSIAQSVAYVGRSPVLSLQQAAVRLGLRTLRDLVLEAALHVKVFRVPGYDDLMARLYRHSTATAHVMRAVCRRAALRFDYGFLAGLLHDVGFAAGLQVLVEHPEWRRAPFAAVSPVLDAVHADASGQLARRWELPEPIREVVEYHHALSIDGEVRPVHAALMVAEQLCWEAGAGMLPPPEEASPTSDGTPEPPLGGLDVNGVETVEEARAILQLDAAAMVAARGEAFTLVGSLSDPG